MILILDNDASKLAQMLADDDLSKMIKSLAQVLCSAHHVIDSRIELGIDDANKRLPIPLPYRKYKSSEEIAKWRDWALTCRANYLKLVEIALACLKEYEYRFIAGCGCNGCDERDKKLLNFDNKYRPVIEFARDNVPLLKDKAITQMPITIPVKYWVVEDPFPVCDLVESHKKYYRDILRKRIERKGKKYLFDILIYPKWSRREIPNFLADLAG